MLNDDDDDDDDSDHLLVRTKALNRRTVAALRRRREPLHDQFWHLAPASFHNILDFGLLAQLAKF